MSGYGSLALSYDALTGDVDYEKWADFYELIFKTENVKVESILDLACGTGTLLHILAGRGYDMTGADISPDMLSIASGKFKSGARPLLLHQDMRKLDLYGTVDCAVCCLDGINHLRGPSDALLTFGRLQYFINPGGMFIFDINSIEKLRAQDGGMFIDETDDVYCVWRTEFSEESRICHYGFDIFERPAKDLWQRSFEEHEEYAFELNKLEDMLTASNFKDVKFYADKRLEAPGQDEQRIFVTAIRC